ncbi:AfsR/SARP family transcriptional regulator [Streptomyces sp. CA2R106]|uniref:AfsR/SARP family transcriptional regulator n=1 Tax=Streptomyces sp. CA2R106 TaxID=3120153 RepID=UPI00300A96EB
MRRRAQALAVRLLGPYEVTVGACPVAVPAGRLRALLTGLALSAGQVVPLDALASGVFDEQQPANPRGSLQTYVLRLRHLLGADAILTTDAGYRLDVLPAQVDALLFQELLEAASAADGATAHELLTRALGLWRGTPLADAGSTSLEREYAPALTERFLTASERHLDLGLALGAGQPPGEPIARLRELTARYPLRESLWARLLTTLLAADRQAEALQAYERLRRLLAEELGADPSPRLQELHQRLLRQEVSPPQPREAGLLPPGPHAPPSPATHRDSPPVPRQLPPPAEGFVGRTQEAAALDGLLVPCADTSGRAPVAVVHGAGGMGKTALVVRWAHRVVDRFPDGQLHLDLHGYGPGAPLSAHESLGMLLADIGVPADRIPPGVDGRAALWRSTLADRRVLLVLDNARSAEQVRPLLTGPGGTVVVTSRNRLSGLSVREGARSIPLSELPEPDCVRVLAAGAGARRVGAEPDAAARLIRVCGRLPLALRIVADAASRHPGVRLAEIADDFAAREGVQGSLDVLAVTSDPATDPRTVLSWSYDQLDDECARLFRHLGLVPGTRFGSAAVAALTARPPGTVRSSLRTLATLHLLEEESPDRYRMHDLLREYAWERAEADEPPENRCRARERLLTWYLHGVDAAADTIYSRWVRLAPPPGTPAAPVPRFGADAARATAWLDAECAALVAAVVHAAQHGPRPLSWLLADRLRGYFWRSKRTQEWQTSAEAALAAADAEGDAAALAAVRLNLADLHTHGNRVADAVPLYLRARDLADEAGRPELTALALNGLAAAYWRAGRLRESADHLGEVLDLNDRLGHAYGRFSNLLNLGAVLFRLGRTGAAYDRLHAGLALAEGRHEEAQALVSLASVTHALGRLPESLAHAEQALPTLRESNDTGRVVDCHRYLSKSHADLGHEAQALAAARAAAEISSTVGDHLVEAEALANAGMVHAHFGHFEDARTLCARALDLALEGGLRHLEATARTGLSRAAAGLGDLDGAVAHAETAVAVIREHGFADREGTALLALAEARFAQADSEAAADLARRAARAHERAGQRVGAARSLLLQGRALTAPAAVPPLERALRIFAELGSPEEAEARAALRAVR